MYVDEVYVILYILFTDSSWFFEFMIIDLSTSK